VSREDLVVDIVLDRLDDLFDRRRRKPHSISRAIMKDAVLRAAITIAESVKDGEKNKVNG
jgi:hypothetical protein